jgi:hypothetical protein
MPRKKVAKKKVRKIRGRGFLSDAAKFIKDNHLLSKGLGMIPHPGAQAAAQIAAMAGLGRQRGRGIFGDIGSGLGSIAGGLGGGIGSIAHGLFGSGRNVNRAMVYVPVVAL